MPTIDKECTSFRNFIYGSDGIASKWLKAGASGWRLDVADELPIDFLKALRKTVKGTKDDALLMGEVWEDASNKVSYGNLRNYCYGDTLDSVMNYPIRDALIDFIMGSIDSIEAIAILNSQLENYPAEFLHENMNLLGSHDRARLRTILSGAPPADSITRNEQASYIPDARQAKYASERTMALASMMFTMPGVPHIYYGDEAGLGGMADPFNRKCYPWGREDKQLLEFFKRISTFRKDNEVLINGDTEYFQGELSVGCRRVYGSHEVISMFNRDISKSDTVSFNVISGKILVDLFTGKETDSNISDKMSIDLKPLQFKVLYTSDS
jgi:4-alpha-glucanotransferase